jgi:two-component system, NtrC family, nitrogen regulation sensor histidine kinase NtrY
MPKRILYGLGAVVFLFSVTLIVWQGSFRFPTSFGSFGPDDPEETFVFYGISILIFLLMVTLGFYLVRLIWKLWIERRSDRPGSRIRTKLVVGALLLSLMPVFFMVVFSVDVLSNTISKWFSRPAQHELVDFDKIARALERQTRDRAEAEAELLAVNPDTKLTLAGLSSDTGWLARFCMRRGILAASIIPAESDKPIASVGTFPGPEDPPTITVEAPVERSKVRVAMAVPVDIAQQQQAIEDYHHEFDQLSSQRRAIWHNYLWLLALIALFVFVVAGWLAHFLARQISGPISALLSAIEEISKGNLGYRVKVNAVDELALLVSGFNKMTGDLEANRSEIEARRRFTEAILESIPTGVISVDSNGGIQLVNKALAEIFPDSDPRNAVRLEDLFGREDAAEIRYLMNRARRVGHANQQLEVETAEKTLHLAVTVSAIEGRRGSGFVIVIEDTSDLLQAQKIAAWSEVARRVAHEIRNPLTPITLSAERIVRQIGRLPGSGQGGGLPAAVDKVVRECAAIILDETASVKRLVDEFSEFSRLPAAQPVTCELNDVVANGIGVFEGRLDGIEVQVDLAAELPAVSVDPEQFKRVVVNLIDNAAEAMQDSPVKMLNIQTRPGPADTVEIIFADTGCGITPEQKEKLFLPYFSTKGRGTGLGLAIVSHILTEHNASIRVEDNKPCGAWFTVEVPVAQVDKQTANRQPDKETAPVTAALA